MEGIKSLFDTLGNLVWGPYMLVLLVGTGVYLTVRLLGLQFTLLPYALKQAFMPHKKKADGSDHEGDISHFGALMTALSATIGTGNIAGVATAVVLGGPGAVFWMWITAIFGMATKYGEGVLAVKYRVVNSKGQMSGGPMYYIERGLGKNWKWMAYAFAFFGTVASFGIGSSVQSNSVAQAVHTSFGIDGWITGVVLTVFTGIVVLGGIKSIAKASSIIVPIMAVFYVLGGLAIIIYNAHLLGDAVGLIFSDAFTGSAPIAAAAAKTDHPVRQALVSMTGTFIDTIVVCSITGIVLVMGLISTGHFVKPELTGAALTTSTFNQLLPGPGGWVVSIGLIFFAYSTILGWSYYGEKCAAYVFGDGATLIYRLVYVGTVMLGTVASLDLVWSAADTFNGLMAIPNLIALLLLSGVIIKETKDFKAKRASGELH